MRFAFLAALWAALFYSQSAAAQSMMRPGTSPDPGLKGFWRVVSAKNAPWGRAPAHMGRRTAGQGQLFYAFASDDVVPADHLVRKIEAVLDLGWVHAELAPFYAQTGRPSIDPELMLRTLILGYVFAIRSERKICAEVQVNLAYRRFCRLLAKYQASLACRS